MFIDYDWVIPVQLIPNNSPKMCYHCKNLLPL